MSTSSSPEMQQLASALAEGVASIGSCASSDDLRTLMSALTGKKGAIATVKSSLGKVTDIEARKALGSAVNDAMNELQSAADARSRELRTAEFASQVEAERVVMTVMMPAQRAPSR